MGVSIPFVRDLTFQYGVPDQVSPLIRRVIAPNAGPFTFTGTGVYIIGRGEVAVIDPGPEIDRHFEALKTALAGERVTHVLVSHSHMDHSPLAHPLARWAGCEVLACDAVPIETQSEVRMEAGDDLRFRPDRHFADGETISGPGWTIEAISTPGHTASHMCYALREENALFSGDHIMGWSTSVISPPDGDMQAYLDSLARIAAREFSTLWPTHGPPITEPGPFIEAFRAHRLEREAQILARIAAGESRIKNIVPVVYSAVDSRLWPAAAHSTLSHMIRLVQIGAVICDGEPGLESDYFMP
jgi:glyoxylase-like metal-dependent hydrolase (beta-lactamase superfamily II)